MDKSELKKQLKLLKVPKNYCSLNGIELPDRIILSGESRKWLVYYFSERGERSSEKYFSTEDQACQYIYDHLKERKNILDPVSQLNDSIDTLKEGRSLKVGEFILEMSFNGRIRVDGYIFYNSINEIPKSILKDKLKELKANFAILIKEAMLFKEFSTRVGLDYYIVLDYQTGGISICAEIEGRYKDFI